MRKLPSQKKKTKQQYNAGFALPLVRAADENFFPEAINILIRILPTRSDYLTAIASFETDFRGDPREDSSQGLSLIK
jgi:hypothetical protein